MSDHRQWIPVDFMDEGGPNPATTPHDWVKRLDDGAWILTYEDVLAEEDPPTTVLGHGEIVQFASLTDYGSARIEVKADGTWTCDREMPVGAKQCAIMAGWQLDTLGTSVAESVKLLTETPGFEPDDDYAISFYTYSDPIDLTFDAASGTFIIPDGV
jgi:hypothetical protein